MTNTTEQLILDLHKIDTRLGMWAAELAKQGKDAEEIKTLLRVAAVKSGRD